MPSLRCASPNDLRVVLCAVCPSQLQPARRSIALNIRGSTQVTRARPSKRKPSTTRATMTTRATPTRVRRSAALALQLTAACPDLLRSAACTLCGRDASGLFSRAACKAAGPRVKQLVTRSRASIMRNRHWTSIAPPLPTAHSSWPDGLNRPVRPEYNCRWPAHGSKS